MATMPMPSPPIQIACGGIGDMVLPGITLIGDGDGTAIGIIPITHGIITTIITWIGIIITIIITVTSRRTMWEDDTLHTMPIPTVLRASIAPIYLHVRVTATV